MSLDRLWAGWRSHYVEGLVTARLAGSDGDERVGEGRSLFERVLDLSDEDGYVVHRDELCAALLNAYPYTNGHLLVLPVRAVARLDELAPAEEVALWACVRQAVAALEAAFGCDGVNVGLNLGEAAGAGVPGHLHVHVLPRWAGDTNFMTSIAETRVLPESLGSSWRKLRDAWRA